MTITKAITIFGNAAGGVAGMTPSPGTSGIVISAGASDVINLGGLIFDGVNASGTSGVVFTSGARLYIENCAFLGFTTSGITFSPGAGSATTTQLVVQDTTILNNATGMLIQPTGGIAANVSLRWLHIDNNSGEGLRVDGTGGTGAINATLADSTASLNASNGIDAVSGPGNATRRHHARGRGLERFGRHPVQSIERRHRERDRGQLDALRQCHRHPGDRRRRPAQLWQ